MSLTNIISLILIVAMFAAMIAYKIVVKKHRNDPEFMARQHEREAEYRRKLQEEADIDSYLMKGYEDSSDDAI